MTVQLNRETASEYVQGYYAAIAGHTSTIAKAMPVTNEDGIPMVIVHADVTWDNLTERQVWDCWLEDDGMGGQCLYGEF